MRWSAGDASMTRSPRRLASPERRSVNIRSRSALVHVHGNELAEERGVRGSTPAGVIRHHVIGRIKTQAVSIMGHTAGMPEHLLMVRAISPLPSGMRCSACTVPLPCLKIVNESAVCEHRTFRFRVPPRRAGGARRRRFCPHSPRRCRGRRTAVVEARAATVTWVTPVKPSSASSSWAAVSAACRLRTTRGSGRL